MFTSIAFEGQSKEKDGLIDLTYLLEDTTSTIRLTVPVELDIYRNRGDASIIPSGLISIYKHLNQSIPKNLALFYAYSMPKNLPIKAQLELIKIDQIWTDLYFPTVQYKQYYKCVCNQLNMVRFGKSK